MVQLVELTKRFEARTVVDRLTLTVERGEWFILIGPNGAGKTTTLNMVTGVLPPTSGKAFVDGMNVRLDPVAVRQKIGVMQDNPYLFPYLTGLQYLQFVADVRRLERTTALRRAAELLDLFDLRDAANVPSDHYSHGMVRKLALAASLMSKPEVLFLDEPMSDLDPASANLVRAVLRHLRDKGVTVFMSTHILGVTEKVCDRIGILNQGRLLSSGTLEETLSVHPGSTLEEICLSVTGTDVESKLRLLEEGRGER